MRFFSIIVIISISSHFVFGETYKRNVLIQVIDEDTKKPVEGAVVSTYYRDYKAYKNMKPAKSAAVTNSKGLAYLIVEIYDAIESNSKWDDDKYRVPDYDLEIDNKFYKGSYGIANIGNDTLVKRSPKFIPTEPDDIFELTSLKVQREAKRIKKEKELKAEKKAQEILAKDPDFWPNEGYHQTDQGEVFGIIVDIKWGLGKKPQESDESNVIAVKKYIELYMQGEDNLDIQEVLFINKDIALIEASTYHGPLAAAGYRLVVVKENDKWKVLRQYLTWIS